jgi:hypothetical protein
MSYVNKIYRAPPARQRITSADPVVPGLALKALQAALRADGDLQPKLHKNTGSTRGASSSDVKTSGSSRADGGGAGTDTAGASDAGARKGDADKSGLFDELGLPPDPTPAQIDKLTKDILAATRNGGDKSDTDLSLLDAATLTPLQRLLMKAVNGMPREELESHPELLDAVRRGFATEGGQQLAWRINMLDGGIVGNLSDPSLASLLDWTSGLPSETIVAIGFDVDPAVSSTLTPALVKWVEEARDRSRIGSRADQLPALFKGAPIRIKVDPDQTEPVKLDVATRTITVKGDLAPDELVRLRSLLGVLATSASGPAVPEGPAGGASLLEQALEFDDSIPLETRQILLAAAENSPTFRNVLLRSAKLLGKITVSIAPDQAGAGYLTFMGKARILLKFASPEALAATTMFELGNAAQLPSILGAGRSPQDSFTPAEIDDYSARIHRGYFKKQPAERSRFLEWARQQHPGKPDAALTGDNDLIVRYLHLHHGGADRVRAATRTAIAIDAQEMDTVLLLERMGVELEELSADGALSGANARFMTGTAISAIRQYRFKVDEWAETGNFRKAGLTVQINSGHTGSNLHQELGNSAGSIAASATDAIADAEADAALTEAGTAAGAAAHTDVRAAAATHGPTNRAAIAEAAEATLWQRSQALAAQMLEHPAVKNVLRATGRGLEAAALAVMAYDLAKAIHTDVKNGDRSAPATRKALAELLGGVSLGVGVGAAGAATGAALGSLAGPIGAAVGGFIGGLFGGALGFAAGTRLVDRALENNKKPLDHLIDSVLDQQGDIAAVNAGAIGALQTLTGSGGGLGTAPDRTPEPKPPAEPSQDQLNLAQRVVQAGSTNDDYANRKELIAGFEEARYQLKAGQPGTDFSDAFPVNRLIATYGASGSGALTEDELAQALADGALVLHDDGTVTVDTAVLHARQRSHAGHIASRVVDAGAKAETADEGDLRDGFGEAGYSLKASGKDIDALMRVFGDANGRIGKSALAAAIQVGAVVIAADGTVRVDRAVLALA